jgi:hypothetical protein
MKAVFSDLQPTSLIVRDGTLCEVRALSESSVSVGMVNVEITDTYTPDQFDAAGFVLAAGKE